MLISIWLKHVKTGIFHCETPSRSPLSIGFSLVPRLALPAPADAALAAEATEDDTAGAAAEGAAAAVGAAAEASPEMSPEVPLPGLGRWEVHMVVPLLMDSEM